MGKTSLHQASKNGHLKVVKLLVENNAEVNAKDENGETPLTLAICGGNHHFKREREFQKEHIDVVKYLVTNGANVCETSSANNSKSVLHKAAAYGRLEVLQYLWENIGIQIDIDVKNKSGSTLLHDAAFEGHLDVVKFLVENGAKIDVHADDDGSEYATPLGCANGRGHTGIVNYLTEKIKEQENTNPKLNISSKDPCIICSSPVNGFYVLNPCGHASIFKSCCITIT